MFRKITSVFSEYRLYLLFFALVISFTLITGFNGLYGQDSYEYLRFTNALLDFAKHGTNPDADYWPVLYPVCGIVFSAIFKPLFALQFISILSLVCSGIYLEKILRILYTEKTQILRLFVFAFFLLSPYLLRASLTVMCDCLCLFFVTAAYYCFIQYIKGNKTIFFVEFVTLAVSAVCTRYAAIGVIIAPVIYITYAFSRNFNLKSLLFVLIVSTVILFPFILIHKGDSSNLINLWLQNWSLKNLFSSSFTSADGHQVYIFPNILFSLFNLFHPAYCFMGILFILSGFKLFLKKPVSNILLIIVLSLFIYAFSLAGMPFQDLRHLILSYPLVLILLFPGFKVVYERLKKISPGITYAAIMLCTLIQLGLFIRVFIPFYHYNKIEKQISSEINNYGNETLYTFSIDAAVSYYGYKGKIINMEGVKLDTVPAIPLHALVLFNERQFKNVWKNKNPMLNWKYLTINYQLIKLEDLPDTWELYSVDRRNK